MIVIKMGGSLLINESLMNSVLQDITQLYAKGIPVIVVHGGGADISKVCAQLDIQPQFLNGQRITDELTLSVVQMTLIGKINSQLVTAFNQLGVKAVGVSGQDAGFMLAEKMIVNNVDLGYVGQIQKVDTQLISTLLQAGYLPVIAPISNDGEGQPYNVNADLAAGAIAAALGAERCIYISDVDGVYLDVHNPNTRVLKTDKNTVQQWLNQNWLCDGMIPKLQSCLLALEAGVRSVHIINSNHLKNVFYKNAAQVGTFITQ
jgi:acetylglutamate kinase